jgi:hypothetical protein
LHPWRLIILRDWFLVFKILILCLILLFFIILSNFFFHPIINIFLIISIRKFRRLFTVAINTWFIFLMELQRWLLFFGSYILICILTWLLAGFLIWLYLLILTCFILCCFNKRILDFLINRWIQSLFFSCFIIIKLLISQYLRWIFYFIFIFRVYCS